MHRSRRDLLIGGSALGLAMLSGRAAADPSAYRWQPAATADTLAARFPAPAGFVRMSTAPGSFGAWLRGLPLKPAGAPVLLFNGLPKWRQDVHLAVVDIDVGTRDLQQCADAIMRLRAEWLYAMNRPGDIAFNDTGSAKPIAFSRWAAGERPKPSGRSLSWSRSAAPDASYASFRRYMDAVFTWAGTYSLERELPSVPVADIAPGDLFIKGGFPGHAVLVADVAKSAAGETRFLLLQSFMPAQDIHVLKNPQSPDGSAWYPLDFGDKLVTPEWIFPRESLRRWR
jgi:hypothetical protein